MATSNVKFTGVITSNGKQTTASANEVVTLQVTENGKTFQINASNLLIEAFATPLHVTLNDFTYIHEIDANASINIDGLAVHKFTIQESGAQYRFTALY